MDSRSTHLAWGTDLPWDARGAKGPWHTSVPLLAFGTTGALPRKLCHPQDLGAQVCFWWGYVPSTPIIMLLTSLPGGPVSPLSP